MSVRPMMLCGVTTARRPDLSSSLENQDDASGQRDYQRDQGEDPLVLIRLLENFHHRTIEKEEF